MKTIKLDQFVSITAPKGLVDKSLVQAIAESVGFLSVTPTRGLWALTGDLIREDMVCITAHFSRAAGPEVMTLAHEIIENLLVTANAVHWQDSFGNYITT